MNIKRMLAVTAAAALLITLLGGCGTSHVSSSESVQDDRDDWQVDISSVTTAETVQTRKPETTAGKTEDVTDQYKNQFVGLWDNERETEVWEFKANENLVVTENDSRDTDAYTYWFEDDGTQILLFLFENGDQEADRYSFTFSGSTLTLYDPEDGEAEEVLTRRQEEPEETETVAATPEPSAEATPVPTEAPTSIPTEVPTSKPEPSPAPSPETEIALPEDMTLPTPVEDALPAVECAMDAVLDGTEFDIADPDSFWAIMARYLSRLSDSDEGGYFTVSEARVRETAETLFADFEKDAALPDCPAGDLAEKTGDGYRFLWGVTGGHDLEVTSFDGESKMELQADGNKIYLVTLDEDGAILSVEQTK